MRPGDESDEPQEDAESEADVIEDAVTDARTPDPRIAKPPS